MSTEKINGYKFDKKICNKKMNYQDCEIAILRNAINESDEQKEIKKTGNIDIKKLVSVVEDFIRKKKLICYGGTAINNILPKYAQFYDRDTKIPDYDCYSPNPVEDAKELANIYYRQGYRDVEAKAGMHFGTFKVFVNFIAVADITLLHQDIYKHIIKDCVKVDGLNYAPPDFLRLSMYLELSRPKGDTDRWEKVLTRLDLLNQHHPIAITECEEKDFVNKRNIPEDINQVLRDTLIDNGVVFFGGYASLLYSKYMDKEEKNLIKSIPDFDVLSKEPKRCVNILAEVMRSQKQKTKIILHKGIGELIPEHYELKVNNKSVVFVYEPISCHNYSVVKKDGKEINVATIETILSFYLAFVSVNLPCYNKNRLLCMSSFLLKALEENRIENKGLLKRFPFTCYGEQKTLSDIKAERARKYKEFKKKNLSNTSKEYEMWFLRYLPYKIRKNKSKKLSKNNFNKTRKEKTENKEETESSFLF